MSRFEGPRGLIGYARVETAEQQLVEVQQSSAVLSYTINGEVEGPFVWLRVLRGEMSSFAHLSVEDAREVRDALTAWLDDFATDRPDGSPCCAACDTFGDDAGGTGCGLPECGCHSPNRPDGSNDV